jgi:hypothetical protein
MPTLEGVKRAHYELCSEALAIVEKKGHDYNRQQQKNGETLFNMKVSQMLGITETHTQGILVRLTDKLMRLISLTKDPETTAEVKDESVKDTIKDTINYLVYLYCIYDEYRTQYDFAEAIPDDDPLPSTGTYRS